MHGNTWMFAGCTKAFFIHLRYVYDGEKLSAV